MPKAKLCLSEEDNATAVDIFYFYFFVCVLKFGFFFLLWNFLGFFSEIFLLCLIFPAYTYFFSFPWIEL